MFDDIVCEMPLPEQPPPPRDRHFQTKDLDCLLERYTITVSGRLIDHTVRYEDVPEDQLPYPDMPLIGSIRSIPGGEVDTEFHGMLNFYTYEDATCEWWTYQAKFTDGQCVDIRCLAYEHCS